MLGNRTETEITTLVSRLVRRSGKEEKKRGNKILREIRTKRKIEIEREVQREKYIEKRKRERERKKD